MPDGYDVHLRRNSDGLVRVSHEPYPWGSNVEFLWFDGNYACDCNRYLFFERAGGTEPDPDEDAVPCGSTAYDVLKIVLPNGEEVTGDVDA